jgi:hypothetical protein
MYKAILLRGPAGLHVRACYTIQQLQQTGLNCANFVPEYKPNTGRVISHVLDCKRFKVCSFYWYTEPNKKIHCEDYLWRSACSRKLYDVDWSNPGLQRCCVGFYIFCVEEWTECVRQANIVWRISVINCRLNTSDKCDHRSTAMHKGRRNTQIQYTRNFVPMSINTRQIHIKTHPQSL